MAMLPDVISHDARSHGNGAAGTFGGVWTAGETTGMALGATVLTIVLAITGYRESSGLADVASQSPTAIARHRARVQRGAGGDHRGSASSRSPGTGCGSGTSTRTRMPDWAIEPREILARLSELRAADAPTHGGRVLSYVYDSGLAELDELAAAAMLAVQPVNGLDPTTFTSVAVMEREVVGFARELLHGDDDVVGSVTTGGTESCLLAVKTARDTWEGSGQPDRVRLGWSHR